MSLNSPPKPMKRCPAKPKVYVEYVEGLCRNGGARSNPCGERQTKRKADVRGYSVVAVGGLAATPKYMEDNMKQIAYQCLECGQINISKYDGRRCGKCKGALIPIGYALLLDHNQNAEDEMRIYKKDEIEQSQDMDIQQLNLPRLIEVLNAANEDSLKDFAKKYGLNFIWENGKIVRVEAAG